ncbi:MAG: threonine synthase [Bacteroidota bacterium]|nr:threonine synthase [Bacteroidota bacterium]
MKPSTKYYSTNLKAPGVSFREALFRGLAPDGGLYLPEKFPYLDRKELEALSDESYPLLASEIMSRLIGNEAEKDIISNICHDIYTFSIPIENIYETKYLMRLDQGPTSSFKDFASLFMGRLMQYFLDIEGKYITILIATSGDTGSAVANAFYGLKNIGVVILFPSEEVTDMQRKQMTTLGDNIKVIAVDGKFDDCQRLVKKAFMDPSLSGFNLSSANSINIGRLLPQTVYYFWAWRKLSGNPDKPVIFSVPSGNFGNVAGGIIARKMGLPAKRFVIATNENDEVPNYFKTGVYKVISPSRNCISSAMNVGHPSNMARIIAIYGGIMNENGKILKAPDLGKMHSELYATSITERETVKTIESFYRQYNKLLEPHGAVAWSGLQKFLNSNPGSESSDLIYISLETAHPAKFGRELKEILDINPIQPDSLVKINSKIEDYISLDNEYEPLKNFIIKNYKP